MQEKPTDKKVGGWQTKTVDKIYENTWIKVEHHTVLTPKHTDGIYGLVLFQHHAVGVIPVDEHGFTWLVKQSRYALNEYTWEIPEGGAPLGEDILIAAQRELAEETGLQAANWQELMTLHPSNSVTDQAATIFIATGLTQGDQELEDTEDIELKHLPIEEAVAMAMNGEITDAMSVAGLLKYALQQGVCRE